MLPKTTPRVRTILLVEDEPDIREPNAAALERAGYRVIQAESWSDGLRTCEEEDLDVDVILTDLVLPDRNSVRAFSELRKRCGPIPVVVLSAYPRVMKLLDGVLDGVVEWLEKPVEVETVVRAVDRAFESAG